MNTRWLTICLLISLLRSGSPIVAQTLPQTIAIGDSMLQQKEYTQALYFYHRARYFSKGSHRSEPARKIAQIYALQHNYPKSIEFFDFSINTAAADSLRWQIQFEKMACSMQNGMFKDAYLELLALPDSMPDENWENRKNFFAGTIYLGLDDLQGAEETFLLLIRANDTLSRKQIRDLFAKHKHKNIRLARVLSCIIPGSGQIYAGDYKAGINSFVLTGGIVTMGVASGISYGWTGSLWSINWFLRYYQGGIREAERSARKKNTRYREKLYQKMLPVLIPGQVQH